MNSDTLMRLVLRTFENNRALASARARVLEARAALGISKAAVLPWLDGSANWLDYHSSDNSAQRGASSETTKLGIDASWEIDIFGSLSLKKKSAKANLESSYAALHSAWVTISSETALNYISFCTLRERLSIAERNLALQEESLSLLTSQYTAGLRDSLAMSQAGYTIEQTRASIPPLKVSMENVLNAMAILTGETPGSLEHFLRERHDLPRLFKENEFTGIPADTIRQRPDVRVAERALAAQIAIRKTAERDKLPRLFLFGSIGLETLDGSLFSGNSVGFSFGPRLTIPIFHGGAIRKNIQVQTAREEQMLAAYEGTVLAAVAEVRNALVANAQEADRNRSLRSGVDAARSAHEIANDRYKNGLTDYYNVISAQTALLSLEDALVVSDGQMTSNVIRVFKALGGGWRPFTDEEWFKIYSGRQGGQK
jgi:NodT family efflux transporter outer membrane factor (OMF) lipoprotein